MRIAVTTDKAPKPVGPYSPAIIEGDFIFTAGQIPANPVTGQLELGDVASQTRRTLDNLKAVVESAGSTMDKVVKVTVYLANMSDFPAMNEVYATYFTAPPPARTTIQAAALPGGVAVEIDCIAKR